ncbi:MAG: dihydroorotase [Bacteroidales bacterium]|nr:dihydroorotase [Bacteroidales bacterium]
MGSIIIKNAIIVNEGERKEGSLLITEDLIKEIYYDTIPEKIPSNSKIINANNKILIPGVIDDQVHFREPGLTHKGDIYSESKAAVAGGITSFMDMPNTVPQTTTQKLLEKKYELAEKKSLANYSFYIGATNDNINELLKTNPKNVCGIKIFMGSSTGNMLVNDKQILNNLFKNSPLLIATHCEDEEIIQSNLMKYRKKFNNLIPVEYHPVIRNSEACYKSSSYAVELALKYNTRLHIIHVSTEKELGLFNNTKPLTEKRITSEVCVHHLYFSDEDYKTYGPKIKWNPAIKSKKNQDALFNGLLNNKIDVIATDHAPHTIEEKQINNFPDNYDYFKSASGGPLVQHSLPIMLEFYHKNKIPIEKIVEKMCHAPADTFKINKRGYIRKGYYADLVLIDLDNEWKVNKSNLLYKCKWSPFEGKKLKSKITHTFVNGKLVYENGTFYEDIKGKRLLFNRS